MFNPASTETNPSEFWKSLGTYFSRLSPDQKVFFERYWESLAKIVGAMYYNLDQIESQSSFETMDGVYEILNPSITLTPEDTYKVPLKPPTGLSVSGSGSGANVVTYYICSQNATGLSKPIKETIYESEFPITLNWTSDSLAESNIVFKRVGNSINRVYEDIGSSYIDNNNDVGVPDDRFGSYEAFSHYRYHFKEDQVFLSAYTEDYTVGISDYSYLSIYSTNELIGKTIEFSRINILEPVLSSVYLSLYFKQSNFSYLSSDFFKPRIHGYELLTPEEKEIEWAKGVKYLLWALSYYTRLQPTVNNLQNLYGIINGIPFCYEDGTVEEIADEYIKIGDIYYNKRVDSGVNLSVGDTVNRFDLLLESPDLLDYTTDPQYIIDNSPIDKEPASAVMIKLPSTGFGWSEELEG